MFPQSYDANNINLQIGVNLVVVKKAYWYVHTSNWQPTSVGEDISTVDAWWRESFSKLDLAMPYKRSGPEPALLDWYGHCGVNKLAGFFF